LQDGVLESRQRLTRDIDVGQRESNLGQRFFLLTQELGLLISKHGLAHKLSSVPPF
jgi:hypothetical protein